MKNAHTKINLARFYFIPILLIVTLFTILPTSFAGSDEVDTTESGQTYSEVPFETSDSFDRASVQEKMARRSALKDPENRISETFKVPEALKWRTSFWFDVYTLYGSEEHVLHHVLYPWIIYKVIDLRSIPETPKNIYAKYHAGKNLVRNETARLRKALIKLSKMKSYKKLTRYERNIFNSLAYVRGKRKNVFKVAAENVRVQLGQRDFIRSGLASSSRYLPAIEKYFTEQNLPTELTRLPFVESSFNVKAESKVGASGIWQIMPATGREKLRINDTIDERNSPLKASIVASDLLKMNYKILKDWPLAVTAYNHGAGGVKKALTRSRSSDLPTLISRYHNGSFKFASANFYASFLAVLHAEKYHKEIFKMTDVEYADEQEHKVLQLSKTMRFKNLLKETGLSTEELLRYNLDLRKAAKKNGKIPKGFRVYLPSDSDFVKRGKISKNAAIVEDAPI